MMELQTLQEALKVEIQIHQKLVAQMKQDPQNADLKKQLHELQAKITALSEKQKKVVEQLRKELLVKQEPEAKLQLQTPPAGGDIRPVSLLQSQQIPGGLQQTLTVTPVLTTKTLPLVLTAAVTPVLPGSVLPQRPATIAMVTKAISKPDSLNAPINLQVASKLTSQSSEPVRLVSKNTMVVQATTTSTSSTTAQPIKVPQFVPPPRLTPRPTFQPQVRPKPATPTNIPIAPAPPPPMMAAPQLLQRPVMLATKLSSSHPAAAPIHQVRIVNGQPCSKTGSAPLTGIVIATSVSARPTRLASPTPTPVQPIQISSLTTEPKTVRLGGGAEQKFVVSHASSTPPLSPAPRPKREENPEKLAFMVSLGLVTHDHLEEIQSKRQERKRRTTANPVYSGAVFEPERKKSAVSYLNSPLHQATRKRGRPPKHSSVPELGSLAPASPSSPVHPLPLPSPSSGDGDIHEDFCTVCRRSGQLLMCDTCSRVYHLDCLDPPLKTIPKGMWICPKCQDQILKKEDAIPWPGTLAIVHSYIAYKEAKEEEKLKLMKWSSELKLEREQLEQRVKQLSNSITKCMETKNTILSRQKDMQLSLDKVKHLIRLIQAFSFNQALPETEGEDTRVQDGVQDRVQDRTGREPEAPSVSSSTNSNEEGKDKPEQLKYAARDTTAAGDTKDQDVPEDAAETSPDVRTRAEDGDGPGVGTGAEEGTGAEDRDGTGVGTGAEDRDRSGVGTGAEDGMGVGTGAENRDRSGVGTGTEDRDGPGVGTGAEDGTGVGTGAENRDRSGVGTGAEDGTGVGTGAEDRDGTGAEEGTGVGTGAENGTGVGTGGAGNTGTGTQSEVMSTSDTPPGVDLPAPSAAATVVATTNGTTEPTRPDRDPAGDATSATNSENKMAAVHPPETAVDRRREEISDSTNNSKTSEPSQNSLPALVSSLDKTK